MNETLPLGLTVLDLVTLTVGAAIFFALVALWQTTLARDPMRGRLKDLQQRRDSLRAGLVTQPRRKIIRAEHRLFSDLAESLGAARPQVGPAAHQHAELPDEGAHFPD